MDKGGVPWKLPRDIRDKVLVRIKPTKDEETRSKKVSKALFMEIEKAISSFGVRDVRPMLAGSTAKGTVAGDPDLDIFLLFPPETSESTLKEKGIGIGKMVLESPEKKYTQHPYVCGKFMGYPVDIVPCRNIERGKPVTTAVDRTPHHTGYIIERMSKGQKDDTILLKSFLKGIGSYGAEDTVNGFSGYLCELLILLHGSFSQVIRWFAGMKIERKPPIAADRISKKCFMGSRIGPYLFNRADLICEEPLSKELYDHMYADQPLLIIDPVDPHRNVAAPISEQILAYTSEMARNLVSDPQLVFFSPFGSRPIMHDPEIGRPGIVNGCSFSIPLPPENPDMVITQARSFLNRSIKEMNRIGDWDTWVDLILIFPEGENIDPSYRKSRYIHSIPGLDGPLMVFTLFSDPDVLSPARIHWGPPVENKRAIDFKNKWGKDVKIDKESEKLYVVVQRDLVEREPIFMRIWSDLKIGPSFKGTIPEPVENQLIHEVIWDTSEH